MSRPETASLEQTVEIPAGGAWLKFYRWNGFSSGNRVDNLRALVDGTVVFSVTQGNPAYTALYALVEVDISAFADGGWHVLHLDSTITGSPKLSNFGFNIARAQELPR